MDRRQFMFKGGIGLTAFILGCEASSFPSESGTGWVPFGNYNNGRGNSNSRGNHNGGGFNSNGSRGGDPILSCVDERIETRVRQLGRQGGFIDVPSGTYRRYQGDKIAYLCYNISGEPYCRSRILTRGDMEQELEDFIGDDLRGFCFGGDRPDVDVDMNLDSVSVWAGTSDFEVSRTIGLPLGRLFEVAKDIQKEEALYGHFDPLEYSLRQTDLTGKPHVIQRLQLYPDKLYIMKIDDVPSSGNEFIFQFFIEGESF